MKTHLIMEALSMAVKERKPKAGLIHHSDRGVQYASYIFQEALQKARMRCSMSRKGNCWDNAVAESFFSTLKRELIYPHGVFASKEEALWSADSERVIISIFFNVKTKSALKESPHVEQVESIVAKAELH